MIHRSKRITFRLTPHEEEQYSTLVKPGWKEHSWSKLIRCALYAYWHRKQKAESDNGAPLSKVVMDHRSGVRHSQPVPKRKGKLAKKPGKK